MQIPDEPPIELVADAPHAKAPAPLPTLTGPTGVGKTALSLDLAERLGAEIISADSRQVYRRLDIGTAKPSAAAQARVPHHFVSERGLDEPFSAGAFAREANARIRSILARGRVPLVVGGSGLYLHALQRGLADIPAVPEKTRDRLETRLEEEGQDALYGALKAVDPASARTMDATKTHRVLRALSVYEATGRPLSYYHEETPEPPFSFCTVVLHRDRKKLYARINRRVDAMLEAGLLGEVRGLLDSGADPAAPPLRTIGYREPIRHLQGEIGYDETVRLIKRNSRRYAKRQLTWFRRYPEYTWLPADSSVSDLLLAITD